MTAIKAHFDGKAIVPDEPVDLPLDTLLFVFMDNKHPMTGKDMLESGLIGLWKDPRTLVIRVNTLGTSVSRPKPGGETERTLSDPVVI